jgi:hypothetical protein
MTIRTKRRPKTGSTLEAMTDDELQDIRFFGSVNSGRTVVFVATPEEVKRAREILKERGTLNLHSQ